MKSLFQQIVEGGEAALQKLIDDAQSESVELDFKCKAKPAHPEWDKNDRQALAKALSAFANSMGGLLVYGVEAKPGDDGVDVASKLQPISGLTAFAANAQTLVGQLIMPRHEGIVVHPIKSEKAPDQGYLAVWVERSDRRPHRSEAGEKYYFKRAGSNSIAMEHFDIEDAFNRLAPADLDAVWSATGGGSITSGGKRAHQAKVVLSLKNPSRVSATLPFLKIVSVVGAAVDDFGLDGNRSHGLPRKNWDPLLFAGGADDVVHPGQVLPVTALRVDISKEKDAWWINGKLEGTIKVTYECGCANSRKHEGSLWITPKKLREALGSWGGAID